MAVFLLVMLAGAVDAQNIRLADNTQQRAPLPISRDPGGTVSVENLRHQVPREARRLFDGALNAGRQGSIPGVEAAAASLERALMIDPKFIEGHAQLGFLYFRLTRFEQAATEFRRAIALDPEFAQRHADLGWTLYGLRDDAGAEQSARRALGLDRENASARVLLGVLLAASPESRLESLRQLVQGVNSLQRAR